MVQLTGHNIHYSYTPDRMILKDICFRFKSGEIVSISRVEITSDLSYCKIYVSVLGDEHKTAEAVKALEKAAGFLKSLIIEETACKMWWA